MIITRRAFTAALSLTGLAALAGFSPLRLIADAMAQSAADVAKPVSLPDMALGPADAKVTITEFASMTCPHCAAFNAEVFPKIKSEYIDTGKIRYVFREFPLDIKAAAGSMLSRCIAKDDAAKYFAVIDLLFRSAERLGDEEHHGGAEPDRQAGGPEPAAGRGLPEGPGAARQDRRRPEIRQRSAQGRIRRRPSSSMARRSRARPRSRNSRRRSTRC